VVTFKTFKNIGLEEKQLLNFQILEGGVSGQLILPQNCSRCWKKVLKLRNIARQFIQFKVEDDGKDIYLWLDHWHSTAAGVLYQTYGSRVIYDAGSKIDHKLSTVIRDQDWCWQPARYEDLVYIQSSLHLVPIGIKDEPICTASKKGIYTYAETWNAIRRKGMDVGWWKMVWSPSQLLSLDMLLLHGLVLEIASDAKMGLGVNGNVLCVFCSCCDAEYALHLFQFY
jgi:hypothetical protein